MAVRLPGYLLQHQVTIEPHLGAGAYGDQYGPAVVERSFVDGKRRMIRDQAGEQTMSTATVILRLTANCPIGSRITLPDGRVATALQTLTRDGGQLPVPSHLEVLTT